MLDKYLIDLSWVGYKLTQTDAPRSELEDAFRAGYRGMQLELFATLDELVACFPDSWEDSFRTLTAYAWIILLTDISREKLAEMFAPAMPALQSFPEYQEMLRLEADPTAVLCLDQQ